MQWSVADNPKFDGPWDLAVVHNMIVNVGFRVNRPCGSLVEQSPSLTQLRHQSVPMRLRLRA